MKLFRKRETKDAGAGFTYVDYNAARAALPPRVAPNKMRSHENGSHQATGKRRTKFGLFGFGRKSRKNNKSYQGGSNHAGVNTTPPALPQRNYVEEPGEREDPVSQSHAPRWKRQDYSTNDYQNDPSDDRPRARRLPSFDAIVAGSSENNGGGREVNRNGFQQERESAAPRKGSFQIPTWRKKQATKEKNKKREQNFRAQKSKHKSQMSARTDNSSNSSANFFANISSGAMAGATFSRTVNEPSVEVVRNNPWQKPQENKVSAPAAKTFEKPAPKKPVNYSKKNWNPNSDAQQQAQAAKAPAVNRHQSWLSAHRAKQKAARENNSTNSDVRNRYMKKPAANNASGASAAKKTSNNASNKSPANNSGPSWLFGTVASSTTTASTPTRKPWQQAASKSEPKPWQSKSNNSSTKPKPWQSSGAKSAPGNSNVNKFKAASAKKNEATKPSPAKTFPASTKKVTFASKPAESTPKEEQASFGLGTILGWWNGESNSDKENQPTQSTSNNVTTKPYAAPKRTRFSFGRSSVSKSAKPAQPARKTPEKQAVKAPKKRFSVRRGSKKTKAAANKPQAKKDIKSRFSFKRGGSFSKPKLQKQTSASDRAALWDKKIQERNAAQKSNPFSGAYDGTSALTKGDDGYGVPVAGSKSHERMEAGKKWVEAEVARLLEVIKKEGKMVGQNYEITFGDLFTAYEQISNSLVGILFRAKKRKAIHFDHEGLFLQGKDDHVIIRTL